MVAVSELSVPFSEVNLTNWYMEDRHSIYKTPVRTNCIERGGRINIVSNKTRLLVLLSTCGNDEIKSRRKTKFKSMLDSIFCNK